MKSNYIYHFAIDLDRNGPPFGSKSIENGRYNLISVRFNKISKRFISLQLVIGDNLFAI